MNYQIILLFSYERNEVQKKLLVKDGFLSQVYQFQDLLITVLRFDSNFRSYHFESQVSRFWVFYCQVTKDVCQAWQHLPTWPGWAQLPSFVHAYTGFIFTIFLLLGCPSPTSAHYLKVLPRLIWTSSRFVFAEGGGRGMEEH